MRSVILLCAGEQERLHALGYPKQLIRIAGEPILERTVRQLRARGAEHIYCVTPPRVLARACRALDIQQVFSHGVSLMKSAELIYEAHGLDSAWVLLGDVCWSDALLDRWHSVCLTRGSLVCRRVGPSSATGKLYSEHFGLCATRGDFKRFDARRVYRLEEATRLAFSESTFEQPPGDWTEDIDTPSDLETIVPILSACALREKARAA